MALSMNESSLGGNASTDLMTNPMCNLQLLQVKCPPNHTSPPRAYICQTILQIFAKNFAKIVEPPIFRTIIQFGKKNHVHL